MWDPPDIDTSSRDRCEKTPTWGIHQSWRVGAQSNRPPLPPSNFSGGRHRRRRSLSPPTANYIADSGAAEAAADEAMSAAGVALNRRTRSRPPSVASSQKSDDPAAAVAAISTAEATPSPSHAAYQDCLSLSLLAAFDPYRDWIFFSSFSSEGRGR